MFGVYRKSEPGTLNPEPITESASESNDLRIVRNDKKKQPLVPISSGSSELVNAYLMVIPFFRR